MNNKQDILKFRFYQSLVDIVKLFGETELGECEVDEEAAAQYVNSFNWVDHTWGVSTKEEFYQRITDDIINGFPVWQFLKVSDWTRRRLENTYANEKAKWRRQYKCITCQHFVEHQTSIGSLYECTLHQDNSRFRMSRRDKYIDPKKRCKNYEGKL